MSKPCAQPEFPEKVLVVDDVLDNLSVLTRVLEPAGYEVLAAGDGATAFKVAERAQPDLILLDVMMPNLDGLATCRLLHEQPGTQNIPVIFLTARGDLKGLVEGFQAGGVDYIVKPFQPAEVLSRVRTHLRLSKLTRELLQKNRALETQTEELKMEIQRRSAAEEALRDADERLESLSAIEAERGSLAGFVGQSPQIRRIVQDIERLHQFPNTSVLITGESGTGKELVARAIHFGSARARAPFVALNCVAIPSDLAESLLFGHVKGAFTGAVADRKGYFELAHRGTLFLDEIGDMPVGLQVKMLRVLEDGQIIPVGAIQSKQVDVRVIAATNADLHAQIAKGAFRQDLYFRLARYRIDTPPLRERLDDVPTLTTHFLARFAAEMGLKAPLLSSEAVVVLQTYAFPGNVRELRNILERALIDSNGGPIRSEHLHLFQTGPPPAAAPVQVQGKNNMAGSLPLNLAEAEDLLIQRALKETNGNIADAARLLGVHRTRIYRKLAVEENGTAKEIG